MPAPTRDRTVDRLVVAALAGMEYVAAIDASTAEEVASAHMTLLLRHIQTIKDLGFCVEPYREGLARIYQELPVLDQGRIM